MLSNEERKDGERGTSNSLVRVVDERYGLPLPLPVCILPCLALHSALESRPIFPNTLSP